MSKKIFFLSSIFLILTLFVANAYIYTESSIEQRKTRNLIRYEQKNNVKNQVILSTNKVENAQEPPIIVALFGTDEKVYGSSRSDMIMLIKFYPSSKKAVVISVPRDSRVEIPENHVEKINAAHTYGGTKLQVRTLEKLFDIKIDYYARLNFNGFKNIVNALGGVDIDAKKDYIKQNKIYISEGTSVLDGTKALWYVRYRSDKQGDLGRIHRQQEVLLSLAKKVVSPTNIYKIPNLITIIKENVETNLKWRKIVTIAMKVRDMNAVDIETYTLKTHPQYVKSVWYEIIDSSDLNRLSKKLNDK